MSLWCEVFREDRVGTMQTHCFLLFHGVHGSTLGFEAVRIPWAHAVHYAGQMSCLLLKHGLRQKRLNNEVPGIFVHRV